MDIESCIPDKVALLNAIQVLMSASSMDDAVNAYAISRTFGDLDDIRKRTKSLKRRRKTERLIISDRTLECILFGGQSSSGSLLDTVDGYIRTKSKPIIECHRCILDILTHVAKVYRLTPPSYLHIDVVTCRLCQVSDVLILRVAALQLFMASAHEVRYPSWQGEQIVRLVGITKIATKLPDPMRVAIVQSLRVCYLYTAEMLDSTCIWALSQCLLRSIGIVKCQGSIAGPALSHAVVRACNDFLLKFPQVDERSDIFIACMDICHQMGSRVSASWTEKRDLLAVAQTFYSDQADLVNKRARALDASIIIIE